MMKVTDVLVTVKGAKDLPKGDLLGREKTYVAVTLGEKTQKTEVLKKPGKTPVWDETLCLKYHDEESLLVQVMDKDTFTKDDCLGSVQIPLAEVARGHSIQGVYELKNKKEKPAGEIEILIRAGATVVPPQ